MIHIAINLESESSSMSVFALLQKIIKLRQLNVELSCIPNPKRLREQLLNSRYYYDIFIFDALSNECLKTASLVRKRNLTSSFIFVADKMPILNRIMPLRPSFLLPTRNLEETMERAVSYAYEEQSRLCPYFTINNKDALLRVFHKDIVWVESRQRKVVIHSKTQEISFYAKLTDIIPKFPSRQFLRCHQSYIVNAEHVERLDKATRYLHMKTGETISISRSYYDLVAAYFSSTDTL